MNEVRIVFMDKPSRACRIVVATARHHGDVPALDDPRFPGPRRQGVIGREPRPPDKIAFDRHRLLLILGGEKQASHFCFNRLQGLSALALGMENIAAPAHMRSAAPELNGLLLQCDRWHVQMIPTALSQKVDSEVILMIIVAQLRVSGFFDLATGFAIRRAHGPLVLVTAIVIVTGFFSAFLVNDAICLVMAPLVIEVTRALLRNPVPYLLAVAMASNAGSAATFTGNPQNMIIGVTSHLPYAEFFARLAPAAAVALVLTIGLIGLLHPGEFSTSFASAVKKPRPRWHAWQLAKGLLVTLAVIASLFAGVPIAEAALIGGSLLLLSRAVTPRKIYAGIDGGLLLMFAGLFIVVAGAAATHRGSTAVSRQGEDPSRASAVSALRSSSLRKQDRIMFENEYVQSETASNFFQLFNELGYTSSTVPISRQAVRDCSTSSARCRRRCATRTN